MRYARLLSAVITLVLLLPVVTTAQDIDWFTNLNINAYPSPYFNDWERDPTLGSLFLRYQGNQPVEYYYRATVNSTSQGEIFTGVTENQSGVGPFSITVYSTDFVEFDDVDYNSDIETMILRTGRLPEGEYSLTVGIYSNGAMLAEDSAPFYIVYPDPPYLIMPFNADPVMVPYPTFQWTPVVVPARLPDRLQFAYSRTSAGPNPRAGDIGQLSSA